MNSRFMFGEARHSVLAAPLPRTGLPRPLQLRLVAGWLGLLLCGVGVSAQVQILKPQTPADFELTDEVVVVEKELLVEFPDLDRSVLKLTSEDLWVSEDGQVREVLGVFPPPGR